MCAVQAGAYKASQSELPISTPVTAGLEQLGGGRSFTDNLKQNTGLGKVVSPAKAPKAQAAAKRQKASKSGGSSGAGLRIDNPGLFTGMQI
tara:strand:- start:208 stop:480 length:273 start_codon:yes stop_codon:yes gene_type:complete